MGGKRGKKFKNKKKLNQERQGAKLPYESNFPLVTTEQGNFKMEAYYALQGMHNHRFNSEGKLVECETAEEKNNERLEWRTCIGKILPASFRTAYDISESLKEQLEAELQEIIKECEDNKSSATEAEDTGEAVKEEETQTNQDKSDQRRVIHKIPFLPHAYQLGVDRKMIRKDPHLQKLFQWMKKQTEAGFITRQETVSMVPPVVLSPQPDDSILDMCAAPGSKTCQILEKLSEKGSMVANDSSYQRAFMLVHQLRRIMHKNPVVLVTSAEAQFMPQTMTFDRILADVPCSGDGTSRKNIGIWKAWNQLGALALHSLQLDIAWKGIALLKVGGVMCYSTCSHNPIENEAVVAELLRRANGSLELVDAPLDGFKIRPGMTTWKVLAEEKSNRQMKNEHKKNNSKMKKKRAEWEEKNMEEGANKVEGDDGAQDDGDNMEVDDTKKPAEDKTNEAEEANEKEETNGKEEANGADDEPKPISKPRFVAPSSWDEESLIKVANDAGLLHFNSIDDVPMNQLRKRVKPSCFPPTEEEAKQLQLEKCIRCLSHDNDTGGFFVALLRKVAPVSKREARGKNTYRAADDNELEPESKRAKLDPDGTAADENDLDEGDEVHVDADADAYADADEQIEEDIGAATEMSTKPSKHLKGNNVVDKKGERIKDLGKDDFVPVDDAVFEPLIEFYGFADTFPKDQIMTRAGGGSKILHYLTKSVKENYIDKGIQTRVTIIGSGVKAFVRNTNMTSETAHRVSQEGVHFLLPHMTKRKLAAGIEDFSLCMNASGTKMVTFSQFSPEFAAAVEALPIGTFVVLLKGYEIDYDSKLFMVMWRCRGTNVNCLVSKAEIEGMRTKISVLKKEEPLPEQSS